MSVRFIFTILFFACLLSAKIAYANIVDGSIDLNVIKSDQYPLALNGKWNKAKGWISPFDISDLDKKEFEVLPFHRLSDANSDRGEWTYWIELKNTPDQELGIMFKRLANSKVYAFPTGRPEQTESVLKAWVHDDFKDRLVFKEQKDITGSIRNSKSNQNITILMHVYKISAATGPVEQIQLGPWNVLSKSAERKRGELVFVAGLFLMMIITNLALFLQRREDKGSLILCFLTTTILLNHIVTHRILEYYFEPYTWLIFANSFLSIFGLISAALFLLFISETFLGSKDRFSRYLAITGIVVSALIFLRGSFESYFEIEGTSSYPIYGNWLFGVLIALVGLWKIIVSAVKGVDGARLSLFGLFILFAAFLNGILILNGVHQVGLLHYGFASYIFIQSLIVGSQFAKTFRETAKKEATIRSLHTDLKKYVGKVELLVEQKTREIKSILKHIHQGIFTVDEDLMIGDEYSSHLESLLDRSDLQGKHLEEVLLNHTSDSKDKKNQTTEALRVMVGSIDFTFESNRHCLIEETVLFKGDAQNEKYIKLDWAPMVDADQNIENVLVTVRDITRERQLEQETSKQRVELSIIAEIVDLPRQKFLQSLDQCRKLLSKCEELVLEKESLEEKQLKSLFIGLHTMKGVARTIGLTMLSDLVHETEELVGDDYQGDGSKRLEALKHSLSNIVTLLQQYKQVATVKLGFANTRPEKLAEESEMGKSEQKNEVSSNAIGAGSFLRLVDFQKNEIVYYAAQKVFSNIIEHTEQIAEDLGKPVPSCHIDAYEYLLTESATEVLENSFIHILRNALDHGIESPGDRIKKGKSRQGNIYILLDDKKDYLRIRAFDDGGGLNLRAIQERAETQNLIDDDKSWDDIFIANLIFESGFSTSKSINQISGRGVGMDAVKDYITSIGGRVELAFRSEKNDDGFVDYELLIDLPRELFNRVVFLSAG